MPSLAVLKPEILSVMDKKSGKHYPIAEIVGSDYDRVVQLRMDIITANKTGRALYICSECHVPVNLMMHPRSRLFFFKHTLENDRCSAVTRSPLTHEEINARKYNGAKESWRHAHIKKLVAESLTADARFSNVVVESTWKNTQTGEWRRPDVRATYSNDDGYGSVNIAFEIQLSTTYLNVIAERRQFYLDEGGLLFWIFGEFDDMGRRLTQDDVFYNNNQNAFLVSDATAMASLASQEFHLECAWAEPLAQGATSELQRAIVPFRALTLEIKTQQAYYFDFYGQRDSLIHKEHQESLAATASLRDAFETVWLQRQGPGASDLKDWRKMRALLQREGIALPQYANELPYSGAALSILYSAKHGRSIGWDYSTLVQLAHWVVAQYPQYLRLFRKALIVYKRGEQILAEDTTGKWREKAIGYKKAMKEGDPKYAPDTSQDILITFLFPELTDVIQQL
jgi:hypothetical protein